MKQIQSADNHTAKTPLQHFIWLPLSFIMLLAVSGYVIAAMIQGNLSFIHILLLGILVLAIIPGMLARMYALTLQDRLIRTEETLRYYMLTNQRIDPKLTTDQLIALRFASDAEFIDLVRKASEENLSKKQIKKAIQHWRADHHRV